MPNANSVRRKLNRKIIQKLGLDTVFLRYGTSSGAVVELDMWGEPVGAEEPSEWPFTEYPIRVVVDTDKRDSYQMEVGGLPDPKKEFLIFYCRGDVDIRTGDKIVYPADSDNQWLIDLIKPEMLNDICVIQEIKAFRDSRY